MSDSLVGRVFYRKKELWAVLSPPMYYIRSGGYEMMTFVALDGQGRVVEFHGAMDRVWKNLV